MGGCMHPNQKNEIEGLIQRLQHEKWSVRPLVSHNVLFLSVKIFQADVELQSMRVGHNYLGSSDLETSLYCRANVIGEESPALLEIGSSDTGLIKINNA